MTNSSPEPRVLTHEQAASAIAPRLGGDLRSGRWTRLGASTVLGDSTTEGILDGLAERSVQAGRAQGYARGWTEGRRAGHAEALAEAAQASRARAEEEVARQQEHDLVVQALESAARELRDRLDDVCAAIEARVVDTALALAEAVVGRELAVATEPGADAVRRALRVLPHDVRSFAVRLHPDDAGRLDPSVLEGFSVTVVTDPRLARGDAVAETDTLVVDASIGAALGRVREVLAP
jgi:flagellar assembly protein FliH